jgi:tetratricopeptide (TPR) repeat protein
MSRTHSRLLSLASFFLLGCASSPSARPAAPGPAVVTAQPTIVAARAAGTPRELLANAERALLAQKWQEAIDSLEALLAAVTTEEAAREAHVDLPIALYDLALAHEGLGAYEKARERYRELSARFPDSPRALHALERQAEMDAYLEDWPALGKTGEAILAKKDLGDMDRAMGLGARGLSRIIAGDELGAATDVQDGLDLVESNQSGAGGRLPVAAAQLKFALGEIRRKKSEKIGFVPVTPDFLVKIEMRCQLLLDAQSSYADAIRATDPHWAAMSGVRVGEMYRVLHRDLMAIPPTEQAKTEEQKQIFYGIMHLRYRVLLEKGIEMMRRVIALGEKTTEAQSWIKRAEQQKKEMELSLEEEKATIARFPFNEEEIQKALDIMKKSYEKKVAAQNASQKK